MFIVFKKREFSDLINDTLAFFKEEGKAYFKNYFALCGALLLLLFVSFYFLFDIIFSSAQSNIDTNIDSFIESNFALTFLIILVTIVISIIVSLISTAFPIYYLKHMVEIPKDYQSLTPIKNAIKKDLGRLFIFGIGTFVLITPLLIIAMSLSILLIFLLVGIPLIIILIPLTSSLIYLAYFEYVTNGTSFFDSYQVAFNMIKSKFWMIVGNTCLLFLIIQIISSIISVIPQFFFYGGLFISEKSTHDLGDTEGFKLLFTVIMILSTLVSFIMNNIMIINQGLIYYSIREQKEGIQSNTDIDTIGSN